MEYAKELYVTQVETSRLKSKNVVARLSLLSQGLYDYRRIGIRVRGQGLGLYEQLRHNSRIYIVDPTRLLKLDLLQTAIADYLKT
jgi:hypothetical protein